MMIYGLHSVGARLRHHPHSVKQLYFQTSQTVVNPRLTALEQTARAAKIDVHWLAAERLNKMVPHQANHQGVVCECEAVGERYLSLADLLEQHENAAVHLLALDQVNDPHNLGACLRSADAFGAQAIIIPKDRSAGLSEAVVRAASGAAETVPLLVVTNFARALAQISDADINVTGLAGEAEQVLWDYPLSPRQCWVLGGEAQGLRRLSRERCHQLVKIPMQGAVESLNVSVCAALCLAHTAQGVYREKMTRP